MTFVQPSARQPDEGTRALTDEDRGAVADRSGYYDPDSAAYDYDLGDVEGHAWLGSTDEGLPVRELVTA